MSNTSCNESYESIKLNWKKVLDVTGFQLNEIEVKEDTNDKDEVKVSISAKHGNDVKMTSEIKKVINIPSNVDITKLNIRLHGSLVVMAPYKENNTERVELHVFTDVLNCLYEFSKLINQYDESDTWIEYFVINEFKQSDVHIKEEITDNGEINVVIHATHEDDGEFTEMNKVVKIPSNVDNKKLQTFFTGLGILILSAPYKQLCIEPSKVINEENCSIKFPRAEFFANEGSDIGIWRLYINIGKEFNHNEVKLQNINHCVKLEAKKEIKTDGSFSAYLSETIAIPQGVDQSKLKSRLFDNGDLILEAPCSKIFDINDSLGGKAISIDSIE